MNWILRSTAALGCALVLGACTDDGNTPDECQGLDDVQGYICTFHHDMWLFQDEDCAEAHPNAGSNSAVNRNYQSCESLKALSDNLVRELERTQAVGVIFRQIKTVADLGGGLGSNVAQQARILRGEALDATGSGDAIGELVGDTNLCVTYNRLITQVDYYRIENRDPFYSQTVARIRDSMTAAKTYACNSALSSPAGPRRRSGG